MTKIDIISGFLGAGKTTLIKKLISEAYKDEKIVLIENEFGEIGIDGGFLKDAGIEITEMNSGCICCSLVGDFGEALKKVLGSFSPDRIVIEPSGVGKLSDVIRAVQGVDTKDAFLNSFATVVDANKCKMYMKNFGEFFNNQIENAGAIILSHTDNIKQDKLENCISLIRQHNPHAALVTTEWDKLDGKQIVEAMENKATLDEEIEKLEHEMHHHHDDHCDCGCHDHEHHEHHHHDDHCDCGCHDHEHHEHHHHDDHCDCGCHDHEHHEHHHDEHCDCGCHDHEHHEHHHHDEHCDCGCHDHEHHHHHADEVFSSIGAETTKAYTKEEIENILTQIMDESKYGIVLRAKGIVASADGQWLHFDYVPGEPDVRTGCAAVIGRLCVIGSGINEDAIKTLFGIE